MSLVADAGIKMARPRILEIMDAQVSPAIVATGQQARPPVNATSRGR